MPGSCNDIDPFLKQRKQASKMTPKKMTMTLTNSLEVLRKIKKAFDSKLIDCTDRVSVAKRKEVIALRKEIEQAIDDGEAFLQDHSI